MLTDVDLNDHVPSSSQLVYESMPMNCPLGPERSLTGTSDRGAPCRMEYDDDDFDDFDEDDFDEEFDDDFEEEEDDFDYGATDLEDDDDDGDSSFKPSNDEEEE